MRKLGTLARVLRERELAGDTRAGSYARALARREQREFVRRHWRWLLVMWLVVMAAAPLMWIFIDSDLLRGMVLGADLATATAMVWFLVVESTGTAPVMMGDQAEQWTAQEIRKLRGSWRLVNHFSLSRVEMDHVAVGPAGVLVFETKWTARPWDSRDGVDRQRSAIAQVQRNAGQLRRWTDVRSTALPVRPVVVLWGGRTSDWPEEACVRFEDGVAVVTGRTLSSWMRSIAPVVDNEAVSIQQVWTALDTHARRRDEGGAAVVVPMSVLDLLIALATSVVSFSVGFSMVAQTLTWTGSHSTAVAVGLLAVGSGFYARRHWRVVRNPAAALVVGAGLPTLLLTSSLVVTQIS